MNFFRFQSNCPRLYFTLVILVWTTLGLGHASFPTGLRESTDFEKSWMARHAQHRAKPSDKDAELPVSVKNIEFLPRVGYQTLPNCGAFAPTYYLMTYHVARRRGWEPPSTPDRLMSPGIAYAFGQANVLGGSILGTLMILESIGTLPLSRLPDSYGYDRSVFPPVRVLLEAMPYRGGTVVSFNPRTDEGFMALKEWLAQGELAVFGMEISSNTFAYGTSPIPEVDNDVVFGRGGRLEGSHAFTLIGYDDTKVYHDGVEEKQGAVYVVNSWGQGWGIEDPDIGTGGFMWIGYDYFRSAVFQSVYSMTERDDTEPILVGLFEYEHPYSTQVQMTFRGGNLENPDWERQWVPLHPSGKTAFTRFHPLAVDLTNYGSEQNEAFWWSIMNLGSIPGLPHPRTVGTAHDFRVYRYDDLLEALPTKLYDVVSGGFRWLSTPLESIDAPYLAAGGLPTDTPIMNVHQHFYYTDVSLGLMDGGEEFLEAPGTDAVFVDLTGSGLPDLVVVGAGQTQVYENMGGSFRKAHDHGLAAYSSPAVAAGDFNRDGRPDLAIYGRVDEVNTASVYENLGNLRFENINANLQGAFAREGIFQGSIAWGDYDQDGLEDLAYWSFPTKQLYLYRNLGGGKFERAPFDFPSRWEGGRVGWHDVNTNGLLDLTWGSNVFLNQGDGIISTNPIGFSDMMGHHGGTGLWADFTGNGVPDLAKYELYEERIDNIIHYRHRIRFFENQGDGSLRLFSNTLTDQHFPRMIAVDYNNNGRMDLISSHYTGTTWMGGYSSAVPRATAMFGQLGDGTFRDAGFDLLGTVDGVNIVADIGGNGTLDLLTMGRIQVVGDQASQAGSRLHRGRFPEAPFMSQANTPPTAPTGLDVIHNEEDVILMWDHGTDEQTPRDGLAYNVRVGTWPGGNDVYSSATSAPVTSVLRYHRISADQPGLIFRGLSPGHYYWSVRTVDGGFMASDWAEGHHFALLDGYIAEDLNKDGIFDAADLVRLGGLIREHRRDLPMTHDFNEDGTINQADLRTLARRLVGSNENVPGAYLIGTGGGTIKLDDIEIEIPSGTFQGEVALTVEITDERGGYTTEEAPLMYEITGIPFETNGPWQITLDPGGTLPELPLVLVGEESFAFDGHGRAIRHRFEEPTVLPDGRYQITIPAIIDKTRIRGSEKENTYTMNVGALNLGGIAKYSGPRFAIYFPRSWMGAPIENLMAGFEEAYRALRDDFGFSTSRRTRWPIDVYVRRLRDPDMDGAMVTTTRGVNYGYIEINTPILEDFEKARVTAAHEYFHVVQGLYDPAGRVTQAWRSTYPRYWLDEAMSTWFEEVVVADRASYLPNTYLQNLDAPFLGVASGLLGDAKGAQEHGYGMAPLVKYLVDSGRTHAPLEIYSSTWNGRNPIESIEDAVQDIPIRIWYDDFYHWLLEGRIYPYTRHQLLGLSAGGNRMLIQDATGSQVTWRSHELSLPDLSADLRRIAFTADGPDPSADSFFAIRLDGDPALGLQFFQIPEEGQAQRIATAFSANEVKYGTIPNALGFKTNNTQLLILLSNTDTQPPYTDRREGTLSFGLARPGPFDVEESSTGPFEQGQRFPLFTGSGTIEAAALSDYRQWQLVNGINMTQSIAWGRDEVELTFNYQAGVSDTSISWMQADTMMTLSFTGIEEYRLFKSDEDGNVLESHTSETGTFTVLTSDTDREIGSVAYDLRVVYGLALDIEGDPTTTTTVEEWPLLFSYFVLP